MLDRVVSGCAAERPFQEVEFYAGVAGQRTIVVGNVLRSLVKVVRLGVTPHDGVGVEPQVRTPRLGEITNAQTPNENGLVFWNYGLARGICLECLEPLDFLGGFGKLITHLLIKGVIVFCVLL